MMENTKSKQKRPFSDITTDNDLDGKDTQGNAEKLESPAEIVKATHRALREKLLKATKELETRPDCDYRSQVLEVERAVWEAHASDSKMLHRYATAMDSLSSSKWLDMPQTTKVKRTRSENRYEWVSSVCEEWFYGSPSAMQRALAKMSRKTAWKKQQQTPGNNNSPPDFTEAEKILAQPHTQPRPLKLLDVGSNNNHLQDHKTIFDVVAIDIAPANTTVIKADFLSVHIAKADYDVTPFSKETSETLDAFGSTYPRSRENTDSSENAASTESTDTRGRNTSSTESTETTENTRHTKSTATKKSGATTDTREITCERATTDTDTRVITDTETRGTVVAPKPETQLNLTEGCMDVVMFSLLLSYFPTPRMRYECCERARRVLRENGLLVVICPDSNNLGKGVDWMKSWKRAIEGIGFTRFRYEKTSHLHCMAFQATAKPCETERESAQKSMCIPQDRAE